MSLNYEIVYGEDAFIETYCKDKNGLYMIEIDEGMRGHVASVLLTKAQLDELVKVLVELKNKGK